MATTLYASSHISGSVSSPANALGAPNSTFTTDSGNVSWTSRFAMSDPPPGPVSGTHTITVRVRKESGQSGTPSVASITLYENGAVVQTLSSGSTSVTSTTGQDIVVSLPLSALSGRNLNNIEIEVVTLAAGGSPSARSAVQLESIGWTGDFVPAPTAPTTAPTVVPGAEKNTVTMPPTLEGGATSYKVYRSGVAFGPASLSAGESVDDTIVSAVTNSFAYTVRGVNAAGTGPASPATSAIALPGPPTVTLKGASQSGDTVTISLGTKPYSSTFKIYRGLAGASRTLVHTSAVVDPFTPYSWDDISVTEGVEYDYTVTTTVTTPTTRTSPESAVATVTVTLQNGMNVVLVKGPNLSNAETAIVAELESRGHIVTVIEGGLTPELGYDVAFLSANISNSVASAYTWQSQPFVASNMYWSYLELAGEDMSNPSSSVYNYNYLDTGGLFPPSDEQHALGDLAPFSDGQSWTVSKTMVPDVTNIFAYHPILSTEVVGVFYEEGDLSAYQSVVTSRRVGLPYIDFFKTMTPAGLKLVADAMEWAANWTPPVVSTDPAKVKVHNGTSWVECPVKIHNGTDWVTVPVPM